MEIIEFEVGPIATNCFLVRDSETKEAVIIDPAPDSFEALSSSVDFRISKIDYIMLTHSHWDHTADAKKLHELTKAPVCAHQADEYRLKDPERHSLIPLPFRLDRIEVEQYLNHGDIIKFGKVNLEVRHTPGHTEGGICLVEHEQRVIFAGDTIFFESIGRIDLPGGSMSAMMRSINTQILTLPDDYRIYCGHGPATNVGYERKNNPFLYNF